MKRSWLAALPLLLWLTFFLLIPLGFVAVYSVLTRGTYGDVVWTPTLANYARVADALYANIFLKSVALAVLTTAACAAIGLPMAYAMATARPARRRLLFVLLMVPFLTNFIVRVYAVRILLAPLGLTDSLVAVAIGMITNYLPFMVLPLYVVLERFDFVLLEAARDLGARGPQVLRRVLLPLVKPGLASGALLVFIPVLGEFMIPDLLGGARTMLLGNLITEQFLKARDWPFGAALAMLLVALTAVGFVLERRSGAGREELGLG